MGEGDRGCWDGVEGTDFAFTEVGDSLAACVSSMFDSGISCLDMLVSSLKGDTAISSTPSFSTGFLRVDTSSDVERPDRCANHAVR